MAFFGDSNLVVTLSVILFIALLVYLKVPSKIGGLLDQRAEKIRAELDEARRLREEAQELLASYERKQRDVAEQTAAIVANAKLQAEEAAKEAKVQLEASIKRRLQSAEDQIASAEAGALREVKDRAVQVATAAAAAAISKSMTQETGEALIDAGISDLGGRLH